MLIGVNGKIGSGKDAFYECVVGLQGSEDPFNRLPVPERLAFADKLKDAFGALLGLDRVAIELFKRDEDAVVQVRAPRWGGRLLRLLGPERLHSELTVRLGLQRMGTEVGRDLFGLTFWVDQCVPLDLDHSERLILVTDCRFPNEAERIRAAGGIIVRVHGPAPTVVTESSGWFRRLWARVFGGGRGDDAHPSEQILDASLIDFEVDNTRRDDNFAALREQARVILTKEHDRVVAYTPRKKQRGPARKVSSVVQVTEDAPAWAAMPGIPADKATAE